MFVLTGVGGGFSATGFGASRPPVGQKPIVDTRPFFSNTDIFLLGIAAGLAVVLFGSIARRRVKHAIKAGRREVRRLKRVQRRRKRFIKKGSRYIRASKRRTDQMKARLAAL